ncbi:SDR family NAD(P)-dependent oxidoreductase [Bordetella avium]|nr:SDR family oxidoreductase [Bordetella avium]WQE33920.1 SDR family oxidoreductase [Bordetella avium]
MNLSGKRILLLGGTSEIGREIALNALELGAAVSGIVRKNPGDLGYPVHILDLLDAQQVQQYVSTIESPLDGLVFSVGEFVRAPLSLLTPELIQRAIDVNINTLIVMLRALVVARRLRRGASVVLISSISAYLGVRGIAPYTMAKAALVALGRVLSNDLMRHGIRVNSVSPAMVRTRMSCGSPGEQQWLDQFGKERYPLGVGHPIDVAGPVLFLLADDAKAINGTDIILSGGAIRT